MSRTLKGDLPVDNIIVTGDIYSNGNNTKGMPDPKISDVQGLANTSVTVPKDENDPGSAKIVLPLPASQGRLQWQEGTQPVTVDMMQVYTNNFTMTRDTDNDFTTRNGILLSADAKTTNMRQSQPFSIAYGNGTYVLINYEGLHISYSSNGTDWFATYDIPADFSMQLSHMSFVTYGNGFFYIGTNAGVLKSTNGITWSVASYNFKSAPNTTPRINVVFWKGVFYYCGSASPIISKTSDWVTLTGVPMGNKVGASDQNGHYGQFSIFEYNGTDYFVQIQGTGNVERFCKRYIMPLNGSSWTRVEFEPISSAASAVYMPHANKLFHFPRAPNERSCVTDNIGTNFTYFNVPVVGSLMCPYCIGTKIYISSDRGVMYCEQNEVHISSSWKFVSYLNSSALIDTYYLSVGSQQYSTVNDNRLWLACESSVEIFNYQSNAMESYNIRDYSFTMSTINWILPFKDNVSVLSSNLAFASSDRNYPDNMRGTVWDSIPRLPNRPSNGRCWSLYHEANDGCYIQSYDFPGMAGLDNTTAVWFSSNYGLTNRRLFYTNDLLRNIWLTTKTDDNGYTSPTGSVPDITGYSCSMVGSQILLTNNKTEMIHLGGWYTPGGTPNPRNQSYVGYHCSDIHPDRINNPAVWKQTGTGCYTYSSAGETFNVNGVSDLGVIVFGYNFRIGSRVTCDIGISTAAGRENTFVKREGNIDITNTSDYARLKLLRSNNTGTIMIALFDYNSAEGYAGAVTSSASLGTTNPTWSKFSLPSLPIGAVLQNCVYSTNLGKFIVMCNKGVIYLSPNGNNGTWERVQMPTTGAMKAVRDISNNRVLIAGDNGDAFITTDGYNYIGAFIQPGFAFNSMGSGFYREGDHVLGFCTDGIKRMDIQKNGVANIYRPTDITGSITASKIVVTGDITALSDPSFKTNLSKIDSARYRLKMISFLCTHLESGDINFDIIAPYMEMLFPELSGMEFNVNTVTYPLLIALYVEVIKDHQQIIDQLKHEAP